MIGAAIVAGVMYALYLGFLLVLEVRGATPEHAERLAEAARPFRLRFPPK